ncbi:MAG: DUF3618 domain-containing protein [Vicinamibacterales bacterium]
MDDTTRGLADRDEFAGRSDESIRDYAGAETDTTTPATSAASRTRVIRAPSRRKNESEPVASTDTGLDDDADRRTREIQQEILETRVEMSETIDALQEKLKPANLVADATDRVKSATTEKVRHMAESASETAQEIYRSTSEGAYGMIEEVRQNPIPALMIGAGVAWMIMDRSRNHDSGDGYTRNNAWDGRASRRSGAYGGGYESSYGRRSSRSGSDASYGSDPSTRYGASFGENDDSGSETGLADRAREAISQAGNATQRTTRRAQSQLQRILNDNPLLVGACAVVIGAAIGAALPETERENEWMGDARDSVIDRAQEMAHNAVGTVQEVAGDAAKEAVHRVVGSEKT